MPRLLCIEDDPDTCELLAEVLTTEGFAVSTVASGEAGLSALETRPDLVLCDIDLPDVSGFDILAKIRARDLLPAGVPFIFLTAFSQRSHQLQARQLGCDDYVTKPIDFELLIAIIKHRLATPGDKAAEKSGLRLTERELQVLTWVARENRPPTSRLSSVSANGPSISISTTPCARPVSPTRVQAAVKCAMLKLIEP